MNNKLSSYPLSKITPKTLLGLYIFWGENIGIVYRTIYAKDIHIQTPTTKEFGVYRSSHTDESFIPLKHSIALVYSKNWYTQIVPLSGKSIDIVYTYCKYLLSITKKGLE